MKKFFKWFFEPKYTFTIGINGTIELNQALTKGDSMDVVNDGSKIEVFINNKKIPREDEVVKRKLTIFEIFCILGVVMFVSSFFIHSPLPCIICFVCGPILTILSSVFIVFK